jgi:hypothetical protein
MRLTITIATILCLTGCYTRVPVHGALPERQALLIRYEKPTMVQLIAPGDAVRMVSVRVLRGHGASVSRDTIKMVVTRGSDADWEPVIPGSIAIVTFWPGTVVESVHFDSRKTAMTAVGVGAAVIALGSALFYLRAVFSST